jgi:nucleotide-binding universal stress UspA family protein
MTHLARTGPTRVRRPILVPVTSWAGTEAVLPFAIALAQGAGRGVVLLASREPLPGTDTVAELTYLEGQIRRSGVSVSTVVQPGDPTDAVATVARVLRPRIVVMRAHVATGAALDFGDRLSHVLVRLTGFPVLAVPAYAARAWIPGRPLRILVPLDGSTRAERALSRLHRLAGRRAEYFLLGIRGPEWSDPGRGAGAISVSPANPAAANQIQRYLDQLARSLRPTGVRVEIFARLGDPLTAITGSIPDVGADLVAVAACASADGSEPEVVAHFPVEHARVPVLLVPTWKRDEQLGQAGNRQPVAEKY